jgi:hypothetical protein
MVMSLWRNGLKLFFNRLRWLKRIVNTQMLVMIPISSYEWLSFDSIDNNKSHTLENCDLCCCKCNQRRGTNSLEQVQVEVQKLKFCKDYGLPTTITDTRVNELISKGVTG